MPEDENNILNETNQNQCGIDRKNNLRVYFISITLFTMISLATYIPLNEATVKKIEGVICDYRVYSNNDIIADYTYNYENHVYNNYYITNDFNINWVNKTIDVYIRTYSPSSSSIKGQFAEITIVGIFSLFGFIASSSLFIVIYCFK